MPQLNYVNHCWNSDQNDLLCHKSCLNPHSNSLRCHPLTVAGHAEFLQKVSTTITSLCMHIMLQSVNHVTKTINLSRKHNYCIHITVTLETHNLLTNCNFDCTCFQNIPWCNNSWLNIWPIRGLHLPPRTEEWGFKFLLIQLFFEELYEMSSSRQDLQEWNLCIEGNLHMH